MKYKVGDKVKVKGNCYFNEGEIIEILKVDESDNTYLCKGHGVWWRLESDIISIVPLTFQQKLDRFKSERVGFLVKSKEIADELAKVFEREELAGRGGQSAEYSTARAWATYGNRGYVAYNYFQGFPGLSYGESDGAGKTLDELLEVTLEELKEYMNEQKPQTLEDKLALFKAGTHVLHTPTQEIFDKLMVELEKRGYALVADEPLEAAKKYWEKYEENMCIRYAPVGQFYGIKEEYLKDGKEVLTLTLEDFTFTPEDFSTLQIITIISDGYHRVTAESNSVTAEALCNPKDEFKLTKGVHLAAQRLLEKLAEPPEETLVLPKSTKEENGTPKDSISNPEKREFNVGDTVEVIGYHNEYLKSVVGKHAIITSTNGCGREKYKVRYQEIIEGCDEWWSYPEELKLIPEEDTGFHKGDIVEVIKCDFTFADKVKGLHGIITKDYGGTYDIKLPVVFFGKNTWAFFGSELKLVRKYNA